MPQANFTFNGENYIVDNGTTPPSLWRMSAQGPVLMTTSNPGWGGPELRSKMNQALQSLGNQANPPPRTPSSAQGGQGVSPPAATPTLPAPPATPSATSTLAPPTATSPAAPQLNDYGTVGEPSQNYPSGGFGTGQVTNTPTAPNAVAAQQAILGGIGRTGWTVTGVTDEIKGRTDATTGATTYGPTGNKVWAITGPGGKNDTMTVAPSTTNPGGWEVATPPANTSAPRQLTPEDKVYIKGDGYYLPIDPSPDKLGDPNNWKKILPDGVPNADEEIKKAVERQTAEGERNARQRNEAQYGIYGTDAETQKLLNDARNTGLRGDELKQKIDEFNKTFGEGQRQFDIKQADTDKKTADALLTGAANRALTGAQTGLTGAQAAQTQVGTERTQALLPGELEKQGADLASVRAATANQLQATQIAAAPTLQGGTTQSVLTKLDPRTGQVDQSQINLAYQPKTRAEVAARVGQLQNLMNAKSAEVQGKVGKAGYTADNALQEFNSWYGQQVAPHMDALKAAQDEAVAAAARDEMASRGTAYTSALGAGTQAMNAFSKMQEGRVGPNAEAAMAAASRGDFNALANIKGASSYEAEDPQASAQRATMEALKYIDPRAAAATGAPPPNLSAIDVNSALAPTRYLPGAQVPPQPMAAPATATPAAGGGAGMPQMPDWLNGTAPPPPPPSEPLLPPGSAGVPGLDPRLSGQLNPTPTWQPQASGIWNMAPPYSFGF